MSDDKDLRRELDAVYASTSWRITAPLRLLNKLLSYARPRQFVLGLMRLVMARPAMRQLALNIVNRFPALKSRLKRRFERAQLQQLAQAQVPGALSAQSSANAEVRLISDDILNAVRRGT